jgi:hypothetical protein
MSPTKSQRRVAVAVWFVVLIGHLVAMASIAFRYQ